MGCSGWLQTFRPNPLPELRERDAGKALRFGKQFPSISPAFEIFATRISAHPITSNHILCGTRHIATGQGFESTRVAFGVLFSRFAGPSIYLGTRTFVDFSFESFFGCWWDSRFTPPNDRLTIFQRVLEMGVAGQLLFASQFLDRVLMSLVQLGGRSSFRRLPGLFSWPRFSRLLKCSSNRSLIVTEINHLVLSSELR